MALFLHNTELHYNSALLCSPQLFPPWIHSLFSIFQSAPAEPQAQIELWDGASLALLRGVNTWFITVYFSYCSTPGQGLTHSIRMTIISRPGTLLTKPHLLIYTCTNFVLLFLRKHELLLSITCISQTRN